MTHGRPMIANFVAFTLVLALSAVRVATAQDLATPPANTIAQLKGSWTATLSGVTGCGTTTMLINFTLDATGNGLQASTVGHSVGCGDTTTSGQFVQVQSFNPDGSGFIAFGCGTGCGFGFHLLVAKNKQLFNLGAQSVPANYLAGLAIRK
jgi:hypothetical protein